MSVTFNHTGITVHDLDRSVAMFRELFGFEIISRAPRDPAIISRVVGVAGAKVEVAYVQLGETRIELLQYSGPDDRQDYRPRPCDLGSLHIAVNVDDIEDAVKRAREWPLEQMGDIVEIDAGPNKGLRIVYMRNPDDGLIIELIQMRKP